MPRRVAVIGAGAAGSMAACFAARPGTEVLLLERTRDGGRKILISGGGRCNVLPARLDERRFITDSSPNTLRKMLRAWPLAEQVAFFTDTLGIPLAEEAGTLKLFPVSNRARDVRDGLLQAARDRGVRIMPGTRAMGLAPRGAGWEVRVEGQAPLLVDRVVVATGGLSVPNTGSDGAGLRLLEALGHTVHPTYAALTPVTADPPVFGDLSGLSLTVRLTARGAARNATASGGFLFTHRGYSGPAVLDVSHVLVRARLEGQPGSLRVQWTPDDAGTWDVRFREAAGRSILAVVREALPERLALRLVALAGVEPSRIGAQLRREERRALVDALTACDLPWNGDEGYKKAEVTGGGVDLAEVDPRTMESRRRPGLYLCGEVLDAFGPIGGYNFCWAWATGRSAGLAAGN